MNYKIEEHIIQTSTGKIYGLLYIPDHVKKVPAIIICHGFNGTYKDNEDYADHFASLGYAVYIFDFKGGSVGSKSDGKRTEMSVFTEVNDLENVFENIKSLSFIDSNDLYLIGKSQGGMVSAIFAARHPKQVKKLILIYPAFVIHDDARKAFKGLTIDQIPETYQVFDREGSTVGKKYAQDIWDYDVFKEIGNYKGPVLILHGDIDEIVPIRYSQKAKDIYSDAKFITIPGAGHGFGEKYTPLSLKYIEEFLNGDLKESISEKGKKITPLYSSEVYFI